MRKVWHVFWFVRLVCALGFTVWTVLLWDDYRDLVKLMVVVTMWTMWTSDLPTGRKEEEE